MLQALPPDGSACGDADSEHKAFAVIVFSGFVVSYANGNTSKLQMKMDGFSREPE
jgi:hypothetical protein